MNLGDRPIAELKELFAKEFGEDFLKTLSDEHIQDIGNLVLFTMAESLKIHIKQAR
jgi:hypothetical protein